MSGTAYAATGGDFILGKANTATSVTSLTNKKGTALSLSSSSTTPPLKVSNSVQVPSLNASELDGDTSSAFLPANGTAANSSELGGQPASDYMTGTGQIATEEMALLGAVAKFGMGMVHGDGNTRQCMASAVVAYKQAFGFDSPPYTYQDFEESDCIILVGSNLCIAHPSLWERVMRNRRNPEVVVIDPRRTETAAAATRHLAIRPRSDLVLFYGLANELIRNGWIDRGFIDSHTSGFDEFAAFVRRFDLGGVAYETGLDADAIRDLAATIHQRRRASFWWTCLL